MVGNTCAGKSTLAAELAAGLSLELIELDALYWGVDWEPRGTAEFRARVSEATQGPRWALAGNYSMQRDVSWPRAEVVLWLDLGLREVVWRLLRRTYKRCRSRELLWGMNRERFLPLLKVWNQHESLLAYAVQNHRRQRQGYEAVMQDPRWKHLRFVRLRSSREVSDWLALETKGS